MSAIFRVCLIIEAIVCLGPISIFWCFSLIGFPFLIFAFLSGAGFESLLGPALTILGGLGLFGTFALFASLDSEKLAISPTKAKLFFLFGISASIIAIFADNPKNIGGWVFFSLPIAAYGHFLYLARSKLIKNAANK